MRKDIHNGVDEAIKILFYLKDNRFKGAREISKEVSISKSTVQRILNTLYTYNFIRQDKQTEKYELGLTFLEFAMAVLKELQIEKQAYPYLRELAAKTGETIQLAVIDRNDLFYIEAIESSQPIGLFSPKGTRKPIYYGALGQVLLAFSEESFIKKVLYGQPLQKFCKGSVTEPEKLDQRLRKVKREGYLVLNDDPIVNSMNVAAPIWNYNNMVVAGVAVGIPSIRIDTHNEQELIQDVLNCAKLISSECGYSG